MMLISALPAVLFSNSIDSSDSKEIVLDFMIKSQYSKFNVIWAIFEQFRLVSITLDKDQATWLRFLNGRSF